MNIRMRPFIVTPKLLAGLDFEQRVQTLFHYGRNGRMYLAIAIALLIPAEWLPGTWSVALYCVGVPIFSFGAWVIIRRIPELEREFLS